MLVTFKIIVVCVIGITGKGVWRDTNTRGAEVMQCRGYVRSTTVSECARAPAAGLAESTEATI